MFKWIHPLDDAHKMLFFDPQTSGGLLMAVPPGNTTIFEAEMTRLGGSFWRVGSVTEGEGIRLKYNRPINITYFHYPRSLTSKSKIIPW